VTLDVPAEWQAAFAAAKTTEEWDEIIRLCDRLSPALYRAARKAAAGRDSLSLKIAESRERCRDRLDSL